MEARDATRPELTCGSQFTTGSADKNLYFTMAASDRVKIHSGGCGASGTGAK